MPIDHLFNFLIAVFLVFLLSSILMLLTVRRAASGSLEEQSESDSSEECPSSDVLDELAEAIENDEDLLTVVTPLKVPHIDLPGTLAGGGATEQACCKANGVILLDSDEDPNEKRKFNRRLRDRRSSETPVDEDRRMLERRVWLRRREDYAGKKLLNVTDAADTLGVPVEQIYQWLDKTDIPFYHITEGKSKAIRFEINELLHWYSIFSSTESGR